MKVQHYGVEEIFDKRLYFLIPFHIFAHERLFSKYEADEAKLKGLLDEYAEVAGRLDALVKTGELDEYTKEEIRYVTKKVADAIARKYKRVRKGVTSLMGGRIIMTPARRILERGMERGMEEGLERGMERGLELGRAEGRATGMEQGLERGRAEGRAEGRATGRADAIMENIKSLMRRLKMTESDAMEALDIPVDQRGKYLSTLGGTV